MNLIPVMLGGKYFITDRVGLYFETGVAAVISTSGSTSYSTTSGGMTGSSAATYYEVDFRPATIGAVFLLN